MSYTLTGIGLTMLIIGLILKVMLHYHLFDEENKEK